MYLFMSISFQNDPEFGPKSTGLGKSLARRNVLNFATVIPSFFDTSYTPINPIAGIENGFDTKILLDDFYYENCEYSWE